jgi:hypothetical protein
MQKASKCEFVLNKKAAKVLNLIVPFSCRTDEVIEGQFFCCGARVCLWHKADIPTHSADVRFRG